MKIHLSQCPQHPSQVGKCVLESCYCRLGARRDATTVDLVEEYEALPRWTESSPAERDYANRLFAAIMRQEVRHG